MGLTLSMSHKSVITLLLLSLSASSLGFSQIKEYLDMWNWETECWGEANVAQFHQFEDELVNQCLQTPVNEEVQKAAPRSVPQLARLTQPMVQTFAQMPLYQNYPFAFANPATRFYGKRSAEDTMSAQELLDKWTMKVSNLTCYFKTMGVIDEDYKIKKDFLRNEVWQMKDTTAAPHLGDPVFRNKMSQYWVDCADTAEAIPEAAPDNCPISRMFGPMARCMKFMMCKKEVTQKMCGMAMASKLQEKYHPNCLGGEGVGVLGVRDKYEEALACSMTLMHAKMTADMTGQFVKKAIRGEL